MSQYVILNFLPMMFNGAILAFSIVPSNKNTAYLIEDVNHSADLLGFWLDFTSFIPSIIWLLIINPNVILSVHVIGVFLIVAFTSAINWVWLHHESLTRRQIRLRRT